jgi:hypothetical protein
VIGLQQNRKQPDDIDYSYHGQKSTSSLVDNSRSSNNNHLLQQKQQQRQPELRRVQALQGERSLIFVLPKSIAVELGIQKGDYLVVRIELPKKIILEKIEV